MLHCGDAGKAPTLQRMEDALAAHGIGEPPCITDDIDGSCRWRVQRETADRYLVCLKVKGCARFGQDTFGLHVVHQRRAESLNPTSEGVQSDIQVIRLRKHPPIALVHSTEVETRDDLVGHVSSIS